VEAVKGSMPSPEKIFQIFNAYQQTASLKAAIELDVFTALAEGNNTAKALAERCQTSERGMRILCDYLVIIGLLNKQNGHYDLTPESAVFLNRRSPACISSVVKFLNSPYVMDTFKDVAGVVRRGGTLMGEEGSMAPEHPMWEEFARSMAPMMAPAAQMIAEIVGEGDWKVLDIAAGHGLFGIAIAKRNPKAQIFALDWPNVLKVALENAQAAGVADRYHTIAGSAFEVEYGSDYDTVLLTNFLHHVDTGTCENLLRRVHRALKSGGRAVTLEFIPNEDRVSPPAAAAFSLMMLAGTPSGDAYTFSEYDRMFTAAGFSRSELHPLPNMPQQVIVSYKE